MNRINRRDFITQSAVVVAGITGGLSLGGHPHGHATTDSQAEPSQKLVLLFTHDLHSNLDPYRVTDTQGRVTMVGGFARLASIIRRERKGNESRTLLLDGGDFSMGTAYHSIRSTSSPELILMGEMGYDATTWGNHDFDFRPDGLAAAVAAAHAHGTVLPAIIASNTVVTNGLPELSSFAAAVKSHPVLPFKVFERSGLKIGIFGLLGKDAAIDAPLAAPVFFSDPVDTARQMVSLLRQQEKVDMVICLSHCGTFADKSRSEDEILAREVPGIDVILSGHTHTVLDPYIKVGPTYIVSAGCFGRYLGRLELIRDSAGYRAIDYRLISVAAPFGESAAVSALITGYANQVDKAYLNGFGYKLGQPLAVSRFSLPHPDESPTNAGSSLGNLITDAFRYAMKIMEGNTHERIALSVEPLGMIRTGLMPGPLTVDDVFRVMALGQGYDGKAGYPLVAFYLTGREIRSLFEVETTLALQKPDARLQISGMRFSYRKDAPPFQRVQDVEVEDEAGAFSPLAGNQLYRICTNLNMFLMRDFLHQASGGQISYAPKDAKGVPVMDLMSLVAHNPAVPRLTEVKEWVALALYLQSMQPAGAIEPGVLSDKYRAPQQRIFITS